MQRPHPVQVAAPDISAWLASPIGIDYAHERNADAAGPEVLLTALVHGNEYSGAIAIDAFMKSGVRPRRGRITAVFCNARAFSRFDAAQPDASRFIDEDFNRVWSTGRLDGTGRSAELQRAREIRPLVERATHLLDLHSMHEPAPPLLVTGLLPRNIRFAQQLQTASQAVADEGHSDGVRMRDYGAFADPTGERIALLLEAGHHWERASVDVARNTLMRFLVASGSIERADVPEGWLVPDVEVPDPIHVIGRVVARTMDFAFAEDYRGGEVIQHAGTVIATDGGETVLTPHDDCVLVMPSVRQLRPGVTVVRFGRRLR
jgi:predicted deacylase